jgi:poly-gamma-glutamate synthesis protein (capsule biosynthesis protein)
LTSKLKNKIILALLPIILLTGCSINKTDKEETSQIQEIEQTPIIEDHKISLFAVGDTLIHDAVYYDAKTNQIGEDGYPIYDFKPMFTEIAPLAQQHDLAFYNQETLIGGKNLGLSNYPRFNSPDEIGLNMIEIGFNMVNLATNHVLDKDLEGLQYSAKFWEKQEKEKNIYTAGSYTSQEKRDNIKIAEKNGIKYAMLAYTYGTNGLPVPEGYEYLVNLWTVYGDDKYEAYKEQVKKDIQSVRDKVDVLIVSMHWGNEYIFEPSWYQEDAAKFLSEQGVDIIIGTHPHVIEPVEYVGNTLVIYSLGNLVSAQIEEETKVGMMVSLDINKHIENDTKTITINNIKADLTWTYHQGYRKFKVIPFYNLDDSQLYNHEAIYEKYKKIINPKNDERIQVGFQNQ